MIDQVDVRPFRASDDTEFSRMKSSTATDRAPDAPPFSEVLKASMMKVNDIQVESDRLTQKLALGEVEDISEVSIAVEKAELALRLMVQIRDKLVDAYQQVARMSV